MHTRMLGILLVVTACSVPEQAWEELAIDDPYGVEALGRIVGTVSSTAGHGIAGHVVTDPRGHEASSDHGGDFSVERLDPGSYALVVAADGYVTERIEAIAVQADLDTVVAVTLRPRAPFRSLRVRVDGPNGGPLEAADLTTSTGLAAVTDANGIAQLDGLGTRAFDLTIADAEAALWPRTLTGLTIGADRVLDVQVTLSGRPSPDSSPAGSATCALCHETVAATHGAGPHARTLGQSVDGPLWERFVAGASVALESGVATLSADDGTAVVEVTDRIGATRRYEVAGLIGDPRGGTVPFVEIDDRAWPLPIAWRAADPVFPGWAPAEAALVAWEEDTWLAGGTFRFPVGDTPEPELSADSRCMPCHATGFSVAFGGTEGVLDLTSELGTGARWGEDGVGCERCHGPGSSHVAAPASERAFRITRPDRLDLDAANAVCNQCHSRVEGAHGAPFPLASDGSLFSPGESLSGYGTPRPALWPSGAASAPGSQGDELARSPHGTGALQLRCADCHNPHGDTVDPADEPLPALLRADHRDNAICVSCHASLSFGHDVDALEDHWAHWRYDPGGEAMRGRCTECHMPETAARIGFHTSTATGDLASHLFVARPPQDAVDVFDETGEGLLPAGRFPIPGCVRCHSWNAHLWTEDGYEFVGPLGDPGRRETYSTLQRAFQEKFP